MTISSSDLFLFASEKMTDDGNAGGLITADEVQDGTTNDLFPAIDTAARSNGRTSLRKFYGAVMSTNADLGAGAQISVETPNSDPDVHQVFFAFGDNLTQRSAAIAHLQKFPYSTGSQPPVAVSFLGFANKLQYLAVHTPELGALVGVFLPNTFGSALPQALLGVGVVITITANGAFNIVTFDRDVNPYVGAGSGSAIVLEASATAPRCAGGVLTTNTSTAAGVEVEAVELAVVPQTTPYPASANGIDPANLRLLQGRVPIFRPGESVILRDGATMERAVVESVDYRGALTFTANLANSYPSGSVVSSIAVIGDLQALASIGFSQQTWTKVYADSRIGAAISANYDQLTHPIAVTNKGAATEKWAIVFTSTTAFKLIGQGVGEIATGTTGADFAPNNPLTGEPYFTIDAAGWGTGWAIGNVHRFNTTGAYGPCWGARTVSPSAPGSSDTATLEFCVSI